MPTAVIIAGGEGTRLRPVTLTIPKPLVPLLGHAFLDYQLAQIRSAEIRRVVFTLHYLPGATQRHYGNGEDWGMNFNYSVETTLLGTAGGVKLGEQYFGNDELVIFNGDVLSDIDVESVIEFHRRKKARVTITLARVDDPTAYGLVFTDEDGRVERFLEKPSAEEATVDTINAGLYVMNRDVMNDIPPNTKYMFERGLFPMMLERGDPVYGYIHKGYWLDIGTPGKYLKACADLASGRVMSPFSLEPIFRGNIFGHPTVKAEPIADLIGPCHFDKNCVIGASRIGPNVFCGRNVKIGNDAKISNSIILNDSVIADGVVISHSVISTNCQIGAHVLLASGSLIGPYSRITAPAM